MNTQDIIVYCIVAFAAVMIALRIYHQLRGKDTSCSCGDCQQCSASGHCKEYPHRQEHAVRNNR